MGKKKKNLRLVEPNETTEESTPESVTGLDGHDFLPATDEEVFAEGQSELNMELAENDDVELAASGADDEIVESEPTEEIELVVDGPELEGTELAGFESAEIETVEFVGEDQLISILESILFASDRPVSLAQLRQIFRSTNIRTKDIRTALDDLGSLLAESRRGVTLEEVSTGFQLRTKLDNVKFIKQSIKARPFRLSGPALEVLSIVAYKQPVTKAQVDEIRGVESGHLLRALMEKNLILFGERSELPGKPMFYETARKFLEIFGLRNIRELPSLHEIDQLIPEGIGDNEKKETLGDLTDELSQTPAESYSQGEDELLKITDEISQITTSSEFFEQEKQRLRDKRDMERAQDIREAVALGDKVEDKDLRWLERYDETLAQKAQGAAEVEFVTGETSEPPPPPAPELSEN